MATNPIDTFFRQKKIFLSRMKKVDKKKKTKLILIIMANTLDPEIGKGCREDIQSIRHMFDKMARHMKFNFLELIIKGRAYSKRNIVDTIESLTPGSDDIVVFYYSGHGFRFKKDEKRRFPQVDLRSIPSSNKISVFNKNTHNLSELYEKIKKRGARLNIVIGDCCNNRIKFKREFKGGDDSVRSAKRPRMKINTHMCKKLFCHATASILVAAADRGQFAVSDEKLGSIFTFNFTNNLKILLNTHNNSTQEVLWNKLLQETKAMTFKLSKTYDIGKGKPGDQKAIFKILSK